MASNYYLQLLATTGIIGLGFYVFLILRTTTLFRRALRFASDSSWKTSATASVGTTLFFLIAQLFIPISLTYIFMTFVLFSISIAVFRQLGSPLVHEANIDLVASSESQSHSTILPWIVLPVFITISSLGTYFFVQNYRGELAYKKAIDGVSANNAQNTINALISAMDINPNSDTYRIAYSQINLTLAINLSNKKDLTDEDRTVITQLVQQSVQEAKNAITLNPTSASNMENLANIYRNLLNLTEGADAWTIAAYRQAVNLDPLSPNLRIALGSVYYALKNYDEAIKYFQQAVDLKPDFANASYNLSASYREKGDFQNAFNAMQSVVNNLDKSSPDYVKAQSELDELKTKLPVSTTPTPTPTSAVKSQLEAPLPIPSPKVSPIELPADLAPNATTTPTPTLTPTPAL